MGDTKRCPSCGADVPSGNAFCGQCGTKVHADLSVRYCEDCGARIPEGDIFCGICGTSATTPSANNARQTKLAELWVGDCFTFGTYRQGANGEVAPIEWQILQRDDDGLLVISKYALDYQPYHNRDGNVTWSMCSLRRWLNNEFITRAFNESERRQILSITISNPGYSYRSKLFKNSTFYTDGGPDTEDKIFLLSRYDAEHLFDNSSSRICQATAYAEKNNARSYYSKGTCEWWLRSPGEMESCASSVSNSYDIDSPRANRDGIAVRPAMKIAFTPQ